MKPLPVTQVDVKTIKTEINQAEINSGNVPVTGSGCVWLDAHTKRIVSVTDQWKSSWVMLSFLEVICVWRDKDVEPTPADHMRKNSKLVKWIR